MALETDDTQDTRDRYGRLLGYLWLPDGRQFNHTMIADGFAFEYTYRVPYRYQAQFKDAQREAREGEHGLWSPQACNGEARPAPAPVPTEAAATPAPRATSAPTAAAMPTGAATRQGCDPAYPDVCIAPAPPDLNCADVLYKRFKVLAPDPHRSTVTKTVLDVSNPARHQPAPSPVYCHPMCLWCPC